MIEGKSLREIAATLNPKVHYVTLSRYRVILMGGLARRMKGKDSETLIIKDLAASHLGGKELNSVQERTRDELKQIALQVSARRLHWISDAESKQNIDQVTGEVWHDMNHAALARHDRNLLSTLELRARLDGLLTEGAAVVNVNLGVVLPTEGPQAQPAPAPASAGRQTIDLAVKR